MKNTNLPLGAVVLTCLLGTYTHTYAMVAPCGFSIIAKSNDAKKSADSDSAAPVSGRGDSKAGKISAAKSDSTCSSARSSPQDGADGDSSGHESARGVEAGAYIEAGPADAVSSDLFSISADLSFDLFGGTGNGASPGFSLKLVFDVAIRSGANSPASYGSVPVTMGADAASALSGALNGMFSRLFNIGSRAAQTGVIGGSPAGSIASFAFSSILQAGLRFLSDMFGLFSGTSMAPGFESPQSQDQSEGQYVPEMSDFM